MKTTIKKLEKSEVEIISSVSAEKFMGYEKEAIVVLGKNLEIPGFRKGKASADVIKQNTNEMMLLEEMAQQAIYSIYPKLLEENKIDAIGRPQISITKIAKNNDLEFKIITAVLPKIKLPDYKKLAKEACQKNSKKVSETSDQEVDKVLLDIRKMRAHKKQHENNKPGEPIKHDHKEPEEKDLPEVNDEFAKSFGKFKTVEEFKNKIRQNIKTEKEVAQKDKQRLAIVESIIEKTESEVPEILIEAEINKILYKLKADVTQMGMKFDEYIKQVGKTVDDFKKEWRPDAKKRAKLQMIIQTISEKENLKVSEEEIKKEVRNIVKLYKDVDPVRAQAYVEQMLTNEKVFTFLEKE